MNQTTMELNEQELASTTLSYINDEDRKSIYLDSILVTPDGKIYIVEIFSFENKPNILITVNLVKPKQRDLEGLLAVRADSPIEVIKVFQPMVMKPCKNFVVSRSKHYEPGICVTGYLDNNKPKYSLDYNENSTFPRKKIEEQNSDIIKSYLNDNDINLLVYSNKIFIGSDLYYLIEILSYVAKPKLLVKVSLNKKGISDSPLKPGWISVSSSNSASESMYFEPTLITPCNSYKTYISDIDKRTLCLEGYSGKSQLVLRLNYSEESNYSQWEPCFDDLVQPSEGTQEMKEVVRNRIFSSSIKPGNGLVYEFDVYGTDRCNVIEVKSSPIDPSKHAGEVTVFDPTEMKPCASYRLFKKFNHVNTVGIEGYTADDKLAQILEYNEESIYPTIFVNLDIEKKEYEVKQRVRDGIQKQEDTTNKVGKEQKKPQAAVKRITQITDLINGFVYSLFVETFTDSTCKMVLTKYSNYPVNIHNQAWFSEILTTECDMYSIELFSNNDVKVYGSRDGFKDYKTFHWNEQGILLSVSE